MVAQELRIANYVEYAGVVCQVRGYHNGFLETNGVTAPITAFHPLKLTEKYLLKLGFNKEYKTGYIGIDVGNVDFVLTYPEVMGEFQKDFAFEFRSGGWAKFRQLKYVHELQNLFHALTGEELIIKN